jgi:hypothetical protein
LWSWRGNIPSAEPSTVEKDLKVGLPIGIPNHTPVTNQTFYLLNSNIYDRKLDQASVCEPTNFSCRFAGRWSRGGARHLCDPKRGLNARYTIDSRADSFAINLIAPPMSVTALAGRHDINHNDANLIEFEDELAHRKMGPACGVSAAHRRETVAISIIAFGEFAEGFADPRALVDRTRR